MKTKTTSLEKNLAPEAKDSEEPGRRGSRAKRPRERCSGKEDKREGLVGGGGGKRSKAEK